MPPTGVYFDAALVAKFYVNEPGRDAVRRLARRAGTVSTSGIAVAEVAAAQREVNGEHRRAESYQIIEDRRTNASLSHERRRQQKLQDELATRPLPRIAASGEK